MEGTGFIPACFHVLNSLKFRILPRNCQNGELWHGTSVSWLNTKEHVQRPNDVLKCLQFAKSPLGGFNMVAKKKEKRKRKKEKQEG